MDLTGCSCRSLRPPQVRGDRYASSILRLSKRADQLVSLQVVSLLPKTTPQYKSASSMSMPMAVLWTPRLRSPLADKLDLRVRVTTLWTGWQPRKGVSTFTPLIFAWTNFRSWSAPERMVVPKIMDLSWRRAFVLIFPAIIHFFRIHPEPSDELCDRHLVTTGWQSLLRHSTRSKMLREGDLEHAHAVKTWLRAAFFVLNFTSPTTQDLLSQQPSSACQLIFLRFVCNQCTCTTR